MRAARILALLLAGAMSSAHAVLPAPGEPGAPKDPRYCGEPARNADGTIKRSRAALRAYVAMNPCPATLLPSVTCEGWAIDHTWPLAAGGCDAPHNMTWLPDALKSCAGAVCKDRWERKYYAIPRQPVVIQGQP